MTEGRGDLPSFIVHILHDTGYCSRTAQAENFERAAIVAVVAEMKARNLDLDEIPHTIKFDGGEHPSVSFYEASKRQTFVGMRYPGEYWFSQRVREGSADDCPTCAGIGISRYNPFVQCWDCGERDRPGQSSGKKASPAAA